MATPPPHAHPWPADARWKEIAACRRCGLQMLDVFVRSPDWVVRRTEHIRFLDDRTVRRQVSIDYAVPEDAVRFTVGQDGDERPVRVLPLAVLRRKTLVSFDLVDEEHRRLPLLGLRETQALTLAILRAWAEHHLDGATLDEPTDHFLEQFVRGGQNQLDKARATYDAAKKHPEDGQLGRLVACPPFDALLDRFGDTFLLFTVDDHPVGRRHIVKFAYDEQLRLRFSLPGFDEQHPASYTEGRLVRHGSPRPILASLGLIATPVRFPVPACEMARSFHVAVQAPPETSIVRAQLLAGRPNFDDKRPWGADAGDGSEFPRRLRRPSFDLVRGHFASVDLHVTDVPNGSLSRAQVTLQADASGLLGTTFVSCATAAAALALTAFPDRVDSEGASAVLIGLTGALVAALARPDPHRMVTRLLRGVRLVAMAVAACSFYGALRFTTGDAQEPLVDASAYASIGLTALVAVAWLKSVGSGHRQEESPWEQHWHRPTKNATRSPRLERRLERAKHPYAVAVRRLRFNAPAVRVASSEGWRVGYHWTLDFEHDVERALAEGLGRPARSPPDGG